MEEYWGIENKNKLNETLWRNNTALPSVVFWRGFAFEGECLIILVIFKMF